MKIRAILVVSTVALLYFPTLAFPKCGTLLITIQVEVRGQVKSEQSVTVDIEPDSYWAFQLAGSSPNRFIIQIPFNTFSGRDASGNDTCGRKPRTIAVMLQDWIQTVDALELRFPDDFVGDDEGAYHTREKVVLDVNYVGPPWIRHTKRAASKSASKRRAVGETPRP